MENKVSPKNNDKDIEFASSKLAEFFCSLFQNNPDLFNKITQKTKFSRSTEELK